LSAWSRSARLGDWRVARVWAGVMGYADGGGLAAQGRSRRETVRLRRAEMFARGTLARVAELIGRVFGVSYTLRGVSCRLHRLGCTPQVPAHRGPTAAARCAPSPRPARTG